MRFPIFFVFIFFAFPTLADQCAKLEQEYYRYDSERIHFELSGIGDNSALRSENRLAAIQVILQRQAIVLDMIVASDCPLPEPPKPFSKRGVMCQGSPQACRD